MLEGDYKHSYHYYLPTTFNTGFSGIAHDNTSPSTWESSH